MCSEVGQLFATGGPLVFFFPLTLLQIKLKGVYLHRAPSQGNDLSGIREQTCGLLARLLFVFHLLAALE